MKKVRIIFLIVGIALFVLLFSVFGIEKPVRQIIDFGWKFWLCVLVIFINQLILSYGWMIIIPKKLAPRDFWQVAMARLAGDSTTTINAAASVAGDPLKALYLQNIVPFRTGLASVVLDRTLHTIGNTILIMLGILIAFFRLNLPTWALAITFISFCMLLGGCIYLLRTHKRGFIRFMVTRLPKIIRNKIITPDRDEKISLIDREISSIFTHRKNHTHLYIALSTHIFPVLISGVLEIYIIMYFVGGSATLPDALFTYLFGLFIAAVAFFVPLNIGTSEGSYAMALSLIGYDPVLGITIGVLRRLRSLVLSGAGLMLLFHKGLIGKAKG